MEHHANIVPWHMLMKGFELLDPHSRRPPISAISTPCSKAPSWCRSRRCPTCSAHSTTSSTRRGRTRCRALLAVDGSQYVPHVPTDAGDGRRLHLHRHKMLSLMGIGAPWACAPSFRRCRFPRRGRDDPQRPEGFTTTEIPWSSKPAPRWWRKRSVSAPRRLSRQPRHGQRQAHEIELTDYALRTLNERYGDKTGSTGHRSPARRRRAVVQPANPTCGSIPTTSPGPRSGGRCVRAGHHCAKPLLQTMNVPATSRASVTSTTTNLTSMPRRGPRGQQRHRFLD